MDKNISASQFKIHCLAILDEVVKSGLPLIATKRGNPSPNSSQLILPDHLTCLALSTRTGKPIFLPRLMSLGRATSDYPRYSYLDLVSQ